MNCENQFCIYEQDGKRLLDTVDLDVQGQCDQCIYVEFPPDELEKRKRAMRIKLNFENIM